MNKSVILISSSVGAREVKVFFLKRGNEGSGGSAVEGPRQRKTVMEEWKQRKMKGRDVKEKGGCWPSVQW